MSRRRVLFLCTGSSCRSPMAETIVNARLGEQWQAFSAGSQPAGFVHPRAMKALAEFTGLSFDAVITLCAESGDECTVWLGRGRLLHQPYPDPALVDGTPG